MSLMHLDKHGRSNEGFSRSPSYLIGSHNAYYRHHSLETSVAPTTWHGDRAKGSGSENVGKQEAGRVKSRFFKWQARSY